MKLDLKDKRVFISGSSRGIGMNIALKFIEEGAKVIINSRKIKDLERLAKKNRNFDFIPGDVSNPKDAKKITDSISKKFNKLDIVICNVGSGKSVPPGRENHNEWQKIFSKNFYSATNLIEASIPLLENTKGSIICISSICGVEHIPGAPITYSVAKNALNAYIKFVSYPLAKKGIKINGVVPGNINFPGSVWDKKIKKNSREVKKMIKDSVPLKKFGSPEDIANLVVFLSSEQNQFSTGSLFLSDGGQTRSTW